MSEGNGSDERKFLHDIASPLGTAMFMLDMILEGLQKHADINLDEILQAGQMSGELEKIKKMLVSRREVLIARGVPSSKTPSPLSESKPEKK